MTVFNTLDDYLKSDESYDEYRADNSKLAAEKRPPRPVLTQPEVEALLKRMLGADMSEALSREAIAELDMKDIVEKALESKITVKVKELVGLPGPLVNLWDQLLESEPLRTELDEGDDSAREAALNEALNREQSVTLRSICRVCPQVMLTFMTVTGLLPQPPQ